MPHQGGFPESASAAQYGQSDWTYPSAPQPKHFAGICCFRRLSLISNSGFHVRALYGNC
jgi:hypothetical protein